MSWNAKDVMQRDIAVVDASASLSELERSFGEAKVSGFPVVERGRVAGVVSRADVLERLGREGQRTASSYYADLSALEPGDVVASFDEVAAASGAAPDQLTVGDVMTHSIVAVAPDDPLDAVARTLSEHSVHRALVVDQGQLVGIVSSLDLVRLLAEGRLVPA